MEASETGLREEEQENIDMINTVPGDGAEAQSNGTNNMDLGGVMDLDESGDMTAE